MKFKKPDRTVIKRDCTFVTDGRDGQLEYRSVAADLDVEGPWQVQCYIEIAGGKWHTTPCRFSVEAHF